MPWSAGGLLCLALLGQSEMPGGPRTTTATVSAPSADPFEALPLSDEELALIAALDDGDPAEAPPPALPAPWGGAPTADFEREIDGARLRQTHARSVLAGLRGLPALRGAWRWGGQSAVVRDGVLLGSPRMRATWLRADLFGIGQLTLADADRAVAAEDLGGSIRLHGRRAAFDRGAFGSVGLGLRTADRGVGGYGDVGWGGRSFAIRLTGGGQDEDDLRVQTEDGTRIREEAGARADLELDVAARAGDLFRSRAHVAFTYERGEGGVVGHEDRRQALLSTLSLDVGTSSLGATLSGGFVDARYGGPEGGEQLGQAELRARWRPLRGLGVRLGGFFSRAETTARGLDVGTHQHVAGHARLTVDHGRVLARAAARLAYLETQTESGSSGSAFDVLPQLDLQLLLVGDPESGTSPVGRGLAFVLQGARGLALDRPEQITGNAAPVARRTWRGHAGPALRFDGLWLDARAVLVRQDGEDGARTGAGAELDGAARLLDGLHLAFALGWMDASARPGDQAPLALPNLRGHLALRYTMRPRNVFVELRARVVGPIWAAFDDSFAVADERGYVRLGLSGGVDLGAGLRLEATVENALDRPAYDVGYGVRTPGVDFRGRLTWTPTSS